MKLVLIRHGESEWNKSNRFTGWTDVALSALGEAEAAEAGKALKKEGYDFDVCHTSYLKRAIRTLNAVLEQLDREWLPVIKTWKLNERHYGALQGLDKSDTAAQYGEEQVKIWRRSFDIQPPALTVEDERNPKKSVQYAGIAQSELPLTESLKDTVARVVPYFENIIKKDMLAGKKVLITAHGNSIRALVKHFEDISPDEILEVNIPTGIPLVYEFDENFRVAKKYYIGDES
ncbi:MAG: 2,3-diphosphoglycerate-dependent phosphoglycerate mutase, partial [Oscillospiraceae bacterium]|nr:2,3-diphosphoglycerate-dependent phosphoglycerate mutase [Oscillospiraceae bacterium]